MRIKYNFLFILFTSLIPNYNAFSQENAQFSLFPFQQLYWNPATAAADGKTRVQIHNRWQWSGYQATLDNGGGPTSFVASAQVPLNFIKSAVGVHYVSNRLGASGNQEVQFSFARRFRIRENTLAIGARVGLYNRFIDYNLLRARDANDPLIGSGRVGQSQPDFAIGAYYDATNYFVGISVNHLNSAQFALGTTATNPLKSNLYINAGYKWEPAYGWEIQPMVLFKGSLDFNLTPASVEGGVLITYDEHFFGGVTYRSQDAIIGLFGINLLPSRSLRLAGSYDLVTGFKDAKSPVSYEILLSYAMPAITLGGKKKIVRTPRFRH